MTKKELMVKAHKMAKEIKTQYQEVDYKSQLGLCLAYLHQEGESEVVELKGTEKQVAWAKSIREMVVDIEKIFNSCLENAKDRVEEEMINSYSNSDFVVKKINDIKSCDSAKAIIEKLSGLKKYMVTDCEERLKNAKLPVHYAIIARQILYVVEKF